jgi:CAAX prenyl protease-like protein
MTLGSGIAVAPRATEGRNPSVPYVLPFVLFLVLLGVQHSLPLPQSWIFALQIVITAGVLARYSRRVIDFEVSKPLGTALIGVAVFALWVAPDLLFPGYRSQWLFNNSITGAAQSTLADDARHDVMALALRSARAIAVVPLIEELFWRGWLMRWLINVKFERVPLGAWAPLSFWLTAILFASEHGSYWDVGLVAGVIYNWWMIRTRRLGDLIWAHAITNACLCAYIIVANKWEYWL